VSCVSDLAMSVNNPAIRLAEAGRRADGLAAAEEAVTLYRGLARADRKTKPGTGERNHRLGVMASRSRGRGNGTTRR